jgi:hypothetical protein
MGCVCVCCVGVCVCVCVCGSGILIQSGQYPVSNTQYESLKISHFSFKYWSQLAGQNKKGHLLALGTSLALLGKKFASGKTLSTFLINLKGIKLPFVRVLGSNSAIENPIEIRVSRAC